MTTANTCQRSNIAACYVVVGGGIAGVSCAETLALLQPNDSIILLSASSLIKVVSNLQYIGKHLVRFDVEECESRKFSERHPTVRVVHGDLVDLDTEGREVVTDSGVKISFEKLCVCTGARPKSIQEGHPHILTLRDTESVRVLQGRIHGSRRILVVGNGGIATELVHEVRDVEVVWAVKDRHISAAFIDPGAAEFLLPSATNSDCEEPSVVKRLRYGESGEASTRPGGAALGPDWHARWELRGSAGSGRRLTVEYGCEVQEVLPGDSDWPVYASLTNGNKIGCDLIISATGVIPNVEAVLKGAPNLKRGEDGGILVDDHMRSSIEHIYAAGDVCTAGWEHAKHWFQMRLWTQARQMGMYAARCMIADREATPILQDFCFEMFTHVTKFFGFKVVLLGLHSGQKLDKDYELLLRAVRGQQYVKLVMQNGRVQGAVLVGDTDLEETCENLILDQLDVSHLGDDLLNPHVDVEDYFD